MYAFKEWGLGPIVRLMDKTTVDQTTQNNDSDAQSGSDKQTKKWHPGMLIEKSEHEAADELLRVPEPSEAKDLDGEEIEAMSIVPREQPKLKGWARIEQFIENAVSRNRIMHRICSRIWLPFAFHSGITMKRIDENTFNYVLPFRKFNKNWYKAMAGAALVANSEIAGGLYLMADMGGKWTVVCKKMTYRFLRPCFGPAIYRVTPLQDFPALLEAGEEFNIELMLEVLQEMALPRRQPRIGRCYITFHCTPKDFQGNLKIHNRNKSRKSQLGSK